MLIRSHMEELKDHTNHVVYENFRIGKLGEMGGTFPVTGGEALFKYVYSYSHFLYFYLVPFLYLNLIKKDSNMS